MFKKLNLYALSKINIKSLGLALATGAGLSLSVYKNFEILVLFSLVPIFYHWLKTKRPISEYFLVGFVAQFIFFSTAFFWIQAAGKTYFLLDSITAFLFYLVFVVILSLQWGILGMLIGYLRQHFSDSIIFLFPLLMILLDKIVFNFLPFHFGFHWYAGQWPGLSLAAFIGLNGLGLIVLFVNALIVAIYKNIHRKKSALALVVVGVTLLIWPNSQMEGDRKTIQAVGIQGNISNEIKRTDLQVMQNKMIALDSYYLQTRKALEKYSGNVDLIIWPETTLPFVWQVGENNDDLQKDVEAFANRIDRPILSGGYFEDKGIYNSVLLVAPKSGMLVHSEKNILFPIGEVIPFNDFGGLTKDLFPEVPRFQAQKTPEVLGISGFNLVVPICYESLFSEYFHSFKQPIDGIVSISNDAWFESDLQKRWHAIMALARSVEYRVPVIRVTNNGSSGFSDSAGNFQLFGNGVAESFLYQAQVVKKSQLSFMQNYGVLIQEIPRILAYCVLLLLIGIVLLRKIKIKTKNAAN